MFDMTGFIYSATSIVGNSSFFPGTTVHVRGKITRLSISELNSYVQSLKDTQKSTDYLTKLRDALKPGVFLVKTVDGTVYACNGYKEIP